MIKGYIRIHIINNIAIGYVLKITDLKNKPIGNLIKDRNTHS